MRNPDPKTQAYKSFQKLSQGIPALLSLTLKNSIVMDLPGPPVSPKATNL